MILANDSASACRSTIVSPGFHVLSRFVLSIVVLVFTFRSRLHQGNGYTTMKVMDHMSECLRDGGDGGPWRSGERITRLVSVNNAARIHTRCCCRVLLPVRSRQTACWRAVAWCRCPSMQAGRGALSVTTCRAPLIQRRHDWPARREVSLGWRLAGREVELGESAEKLVRGFCWSRSKQVLPNFCNRPELAGRNS